jgi:hypothetical protein
LLILFARKAAEVTERLDKLLTILKATENGGQLNGPSLPPVPSQENGAAPVPSKRNTSVTDPSNSFNAAAPKTCVRRMPLTPQDAIPPDTDEALLTLYTNQLVPSFPFVPLRQGTTPAQLQTQRPFLWRVIRMISSLRSHRSMHGQSFLIMQHISEAVCIRGERSLDLLQGLLLCVAFYHYHCLVHGQFNNLTMLALAIVGDLNLAKPPKPKTANAAEMVRTSDEKRALLGAWYLSSW